MIATFYTATGFGYILGATFDNLQVLKMMFPLTVLPFFVTSGFVGQVRSMSFYMFALSYLSPFKWGFQGAVCIELFRDDRWINYRDNCVVYNEATKTSVPVSYLTIDRCNAKSSYNFYENGENCEYLNIGIQGVLFLTYFSIAMLIFYCRSMPPKITHHKLPKGIEENRSKYDGTGIEHEEFDWKKAEGYLVKLNLEEQKLEENFS